MKQKKWLIGFVVLGLVLAVCGSGGLKMILKELVIQKINVVFGGEFLILDSVYYIDVYSFDMIG